MSFYSIADQLDALATQLRELSDQAALGQYTVGESPPAEETPPPAVEHRAEEKKK